MGRFYVRADSVNAVRRALNRAPGNVRVLGRHDRGTIECSHTMESRSFLRNWPIIRSRLSKAGLELTQEAVPDGLEDDAVPPKAGPEAR